MSITVTNGQGGTHKWKRRLRPFIIDVKDPRERRFEVLLNPRWSVYEKTLRTYILSPVHMYNIIIKNFGSDHYKIRRSGNMKTRVRINMMKSKRIKTFGGILESSCQLQLVHENLLKLVRIQVIIIVFRRGSRNIFSKI